MGIRAGPVHSSPVRNANKPLASLSICK